MKALILVAGNSRRMGELTANRHKTLLDVAGKSILHRMLLALMANGVDTVFFVCGYRADELKQTTTRDFPGLSTHWIENPIYSSTNTAYSVFLTREAVLGTGDDLILLNGDVVLDSRAISITLREPEGNVLAVRMDRVAEEEVKFRLDRTGRIVEIGKHIVPADAAGESVGINRLSRRDLPALYSILEQRIEQGNGAREFYEAAFNEAIQHGIHFLPADVTAVPVMEVDTPDDYYAVLREVAPRLEDGVM